MKRRLQGLVRAIVAAEGVFLAVLLPAVLLMRPALAPVLLLIPLLWGARRISAGRFVPPTPLDWNVFVLLVMVLVSLYATFDLAFSLPKVAGVVYGVAVYYGVVAAVNGLERRLWLAVGLFIAAGAGVAVAGLFAAQRSAKVPLLTDLAGRLPASLSVINPNEVAGVLLWITPLALAVAAVGATGGFSVERRLAAAALALAAGLAALFMLGVLVLTQSRSGWLGLGAGLGLMALVGLGRYRRTLVLLFGLLLVVGVVAAFLTGPGELATTLFAAGTAEELRAGQALNSLAGRQEIWTRAVYGLQDFAFTGMGMGTFRRVVHLLYPLFLIPPDVDIAHAHNHLLQTGLDLGLPGLVAYLALWVGAGALLWRSWRRVAGAGLRALAVGLGGSLLAYFVFGMTDAIALGARPGFLFWYLLGLVVALHRVTEQR